MATNIDAFRKAVVDGKPNFKFVKNPVFEDESFLIVGECDELDRKKLYDRKVQKVTTKKDILGLISAFESLRDAGIEKGSMDPERFGIFTGAASTHVNDLEPYKELLEKTTVKGVVNVSEFGKNLLGNVNPMVMMQTLMNNVLCYVSIPVDIRGVNANFMDYQAAGLRALGEGFWAIREGRADQVIAGGISGAPDLYHAAEGIDLGYLVPSSKNKSASLDVVKPYNVDRQGTVLSEAAAFCVLESLESARKRGAHIYGEITGFSMNSEAGFHYMKENSGEAMAKCFRAHLSRFSIPLDRIGAVYGHGNGSINGDRLDMEVLQEIFSATTETVPLTSTKAVLGETNEASAVLNLIDATQSLEQSIVPGIHNYTSDGRIIKGMLISSREQELKSPDILITAKGFSGINAILSLTRVSINS